MRPVQSLITPKSTITINHKADGDGIRLTVFIHHTKAQGLVDIAFAHKRLGQFFMVGLAEDTWLCLLGTESEKVSEYTHGFLLVKERFVNETKHTIPHKTIVF